jgi:hypothetical protein
VARIAISITAVELNGCPDVTDASITLLAASGANLQVIVLKDCPEVSEMSD